MNFGRKKERTFWSNFIKLKKKGKKTKNLLTKMKSNNGEKGHKLFHNSWRSKDQRKEKLRGRRARERQNTKDTYSWLVRSFAL